MRTLASLSLSVIGWTGVSGWWMTSRPAFLLGGLTLGLAGLWMAGVSLPELLLRVASWLTGRALDLRALAILARDIWRDGPAEFRRRRESLAAALRPAEDSGSSIGWGGGGAAMGPGNDADAPSTGPSLYQEAR
jgi:hypothetical protein